MVHVSAYEAYGNNSLAGEHVTRLDLVPHVTPILT